MAYQLVIGHRLVETETSFPVINPATATAFADCPLASPSQVGEAVEAAAQAFQSWRQVPYEKRQKYLLAAADILEKNQKHLAKLLTMEQGKPLSDSMGEIFASCASLRAAASLSLPRETIEETDTRKVEVHYKPLGVVAAIAPFNYPLILSSWKIGPCLLAGNSLVLKPSPYTSLSTLEVGRLLQEVLPSGVLNVVTGDVEQSETLIKHPLVQKVSFTGSIPIGRAIGRSAGYDLKRMTLELGGNDAALVLSDVDVKKVAPRLFWGAFANNGQTCVAIKRIYAHESIYEDLVTALWQIAKSVKVGDGLEEGVQLGPLCNKAQQDHVKKLVADAQKSGARILAGGQNIPSKGYFHEPTIVADIAKDRPLVTEEQFGPLLPVLSFRDTKETIEEINSSSFGLGGSVWTKDLPEGERLAKELDCGTAWVNAHPDFCLKAPFGGAKSSGIGVENGLHGLKSFCQIQTVNVSKNPVSL